MRRSLAIEPTKESCEDALEYTVDLNRFNEFEWGERYTVTGMEPTLVVLISPKGCGYDCDFCSVKHVRNTSFPVHGAEGLQAARKGLSRIRAMLTAHPETMSLKLFNNGNVLYGEERATFAELHQGFWEELPDTLADFPHLAAVEIAVRVDDCIGDGKALKDGSCVKEILRNRIVALSTALNAIGKQLRVILAFEYIESAIIRKQHKFPTVFTDDGKLRDHCKQAVTFLREHHIEWLAYAMLGGRLADRSLTGAEASASAAHTALAALELRAREVIINSQYTDPILQQQERDTGIMYHLPTEQDMLNALALIIDHLPDLPVWGDHDAMPRVRLTTDKEDIIVGTIGPSISAPIRDLIARFNNAPDQVLFFNQHLAPLIS